MKKKFKLWELIVAVVIPLAVGGAASALTGETVRFYGSFEKPPLSPPGWVFPIVWTVLYTLMGIASYLVYISDASSARKDRALYFYAVQLGMNFFWPLIFFRLELFFAAFLWLAVLWALVIICTVLFRHIRSSAGRLMLPYALWCTFALYLNFSIYLLN